MTTRSDTPGERHGNSAANDPEREFPFVQNADEDPIYGKGERCAVGCPCGPRGELLLCGFRKGHPAAHSWASLPTFFDGYTLIEKWAIEYIEASKAEAERVVRTGRASDPKAPEWERKSYALSMLIGAVNSGVLDADA